MSSLHEIKELTKKVSAEKQIEKLQSNECAIQIDPSSLMTHIEPNSSSALTVDNTLLG